MILREMRQAWRQLRKTPSFTITAALTLAVGIGATTAIFTVVYDVLLKPLPFAHPEQLVVMEEQVAEFHDLYPKLPMSAYHFVKWQQNSRTIQSMAIMEEASMPLGREGHAQQVNVASTTPGLFSVVDVAPRLGRTFSAQETQPNSRRVVILMDSLWRQYFWADPGILGKTITLDGFPFTVIGVMPPSFHLPFLQPLRSNGNQAKPVEALIPLTLSKERLEEQMGDFNYFGLGRLAPGASTEQANAEINGLQRTISAELPADEKATLSATLTPFQQMLVGNNQTPLLILLAAVAGLLLVGCINITNLFLARAAGRRRQLAIAAAIGAGRNELLQIGIREPVLIALIGGLLGILLAAVLVPAIQHFLPPELDFRGALHLDWAGAECALLLTAITTTLVGIIPAWINSGTNPHEVLQSEARLSSESGKTKQLRRTLVAAEVAVSIALVFITGLLTTSLIRLLHVDRGFQTDSVLTAEINVPLSSYSDLRSRVSFYRELVARLQQLPGAEKVGLSSQLPLTQDRWVDSLRVTGDTRPEPQLPLQHFRSVSPDYLATLGLPLKAGRFFSAGDEGKRYAIVSERTAHNMWAGKDAVGQEFSRGGISDEPPFTVIGVVGDARTISLATPDPMMVYTPYWYRIDNNSGFIVRTRQSSTAIAEAIRKTIWTMDPEVSVPTVRSFSGVVEDSVANRRFELDLVLLFAASALLLAGLGVYGVVTYSVVQRQREIGIRLAIGAQKTNIYALVLKDGLMPIFAGAIVGVGVSFGLARITASLLFQVSPYNPVIVSAALAVLLAVGVIACLLPARRAATIEPVEALRAE